MAVDIRDLELNALLEITQAINNNLPEKDLYKIYRFTVLGDLQVKKLVMFVKDEEWNVKVHFGTSGDWDQIQLPEIYGQMKSPIETPDVEPFNQFDMALPVLHKDKLLAVVFIGGFHEELEMTFLSALTNILIVAIENKRFGRRELEREAYRKELEIAKNVQNFLFPKSLPNTDRLKVFAQYKPHNDVGGDYYDFIQLDNDNFLICIADVSGKGVPAALLMSNFQACLRTLARKTHDLKEIVLELNHATYVNSNGDHFITFFIAHYDFRDQKLEYINCGHNPSILFHDGQLQELEQGTTILGMFEPLPFIESTSINSLTNFLLFGYTDGLSEAFNDEGEQFGSERIIQSLKKNRDLSLNDLQENILIEIDQFRDNVQLQDDITMIACRVDI